VDSPCRDVSRSHLLLRPAGDTVLVTDLGSANGTVLRPEGERPHRLPPHTDTEVPDGSVLDLGEDVRIRVIVHDPAGPGTSLPEEG
jgi:pSer/pThr/pTyr-binding forkhead associated (FHA) protein